MQDTYTIKDLRTRYKCAASTIYRNMNTKGYPRGGFGIGSSRVIGGEAIYKWELKYMPWLHPVKEVNARMEEDENWNAAVDTHKANGTKKKEGSHPSGAWYTLRAAEKKNISAIKTRHGKKAVARRRK